MSCIVESSPSFLTSSFKDTVTDISEGINGSSYNIPEELAQKYNVESIPAGTQMVDFIRSKIKEDEIEEGPFYVLDLAVVIRKFEQWVRLMPRVKPFYAVKCNPTPAILHTLAILGTGFDCASKDEIEKVMSVGVTNSRIIFANPCKMASNIKFAKTKGVDLMTFDNADELRKIKYHYPEARLVIRILPDESHSLMKFGSKFGAHISACPELLNLAAELGLKVVGVSFHVGSGCYSAAAFIESIKLARNVFDLATSFGHEMTLLDIGGGFPGSDSHKPSFKEIAEVVTPLIDELFPPEVEVIGEPGRYMAAECMTAVTSIYARRRMDLINNRAVDDKDESDSDEENSQKNEDNTMYMYYMNDGVYGSFNCIFFDHAHPEPLPLKERHPNAKIFKSKLFGPTCDSMDLVCEATPLPRLQIGEWLYFTQMGAYTRACASSFNGFSNSVLYTCCS